MGSCWPNLALQLYSFIVRLVTTISPSVLIIGRVIATSSFVCAGLSERYLPAGITKNFLPLKFCLVQIIKSKLYVCGEMWESLVFFEFHSLQSLYTISGYILKHHPRQDLVWGIARSKLMPCSLTSLLGLGCSGSRRLFLAVVGY